MKVVKAVKDVWTQEGESILIFDQEWSTIVELDLRGTLKEIEAQIPREVAQWNTPQKKDTKKGPGRPKLGVMAREVTLLPRHWEWLAKQPGGASVTLRKLVEHAKAQSSDREQQRKRQDVTYRFMTTMGGDLPGYEEALRALFANDVEGVQKQIATWPEDVRAHITVLLGKTHV